MATRAVIRFAERKEGVSFSDMPVATFGVEIYHHYDGYPSHLGIAIADFIEDKKMVSGLSGRDTSQLNGTGDLVAQLTTYLKMGVHYGRCGIEPGNVYLQPSTLGRTDASYYYYVWSTPGKDMWISIFDTFRCAFVGKPDKLRKEYEQ
jgi:hypothetical protein